MNPKIFYTSSKIKGLRIFQPSQFEDQRGSNFESFNEEIYSGLNGSKLSFPVDSYARSYRNVIRGLHGDDVNQKLIEVVYGSAFFVVIDMRKDTHSFAEDVEIFNLDDVNKFQVLVPPGCVDGHCVTSDVCLFHYRLSNGFTEHRKQISVKWNDDRYDILWPIHLPAIMSQRDM